MNTVTISHFALQKLIGDPHVALLYMELVRHADYKTMVVGYTYRISEEFVKDRLRTAAVRGRKARVPTRKEAQCALTRLEKLGLIKRIDTFVFELPCETSPFSVQKNKGQSRDNQGTRQVNDFNNKSEYIDNDYLANTEPPLINKYINKGDDLIFITDEWKPSPTVQESTENNPYYLEALTQHLSYWQANPQRRSTGKTQRQWDRYFIQTLEHIKQQYASSKVIPFRKPSIPNSEIPHEREELLAWAKEHQAPPPKRGATIPEYRAGLVVWRTQQANNNRR